MTTYTTEQEAFWAGEFGNGYVQRNVGDAWVAANLALFSQALRTTPALTSCIEFGANIGLNLRALKLLCPQMDLHAVEINADAVRELSQVITPANITHGSMLEFTSQRVFDLVLIKGVLIHINPDALPAVYDKLYESTGKYLLVAEYYNPTPVAIAYRGHADRLFKRDFAGELMDRYPDLQLVDYGFAYHRDPKFAQDDITWFLMEKR
jgi:pseudaminic acid biosynthesis-associated methylase